MCDANVVRPSRLFDRLVKHGCKNFVYASSCSIYGKAVPPFFEAQDPQPLNSYARSKLIFEGYAKKLSKQKDIKAVGLRYSNVYGYGESHKGARASMVHQITERAVCGREVVLFKNGEQMRDWIYIDDVIAANLLAMNSQVPGIMNVGSGTSISFNDLVGLIGKVVGKDLQVRYIECDFQSSYQSHTYVNLKHSEETYGFQPKWKLDSGIAEIVRKMKEGQ
jgi:ADP-L-glycero-D-manno-heptose 6-epimerase